MGGGRRRRKRRRRRRIRRALPRPRAAAASRAAGPRPGPGAAGRSAGRAGLAAGTARAGRASAWGRAQGGLGRTGGGCLRGFSSFLAHTDENERERSEPLRKAAVGAQPGAAAENGEVAAVGVRRAGGYRVRSRGAACPASGGAEARQGRPCCSGCPLCAAQGCNSVELKYHLWGTK